MSQEKHQLIVMKNDQLSARLLLGLVYKKKLKKKHLKLQTNQRN